jgi:hypothetical protein
MPDQLENRVRDALRDDARGLPFAISAARVQRRYEQRRRERIGLRVGMLAAAASIAVIVVGGFVLLSPDRHDVATSPTPPPTIVPTTTPNGTPSASPASNPSATPAASRTMPELTGTLTLRFDESVDHPIVIPVACTWLDTSTIDSVSIPPMAVEMFGEQVSPSFDGSAAGTLFVIYRQGRPNYVDDGSLMPGIRQGHESGQVALHLEGSAADPAASFAGTTGDLYPSYSLDCGEPPAGVPQPSLDPNGDITRGTATLTLSTPAAAPVSTVVECQWGSAQHVLYYSFPSKVALFGEPARLLMGLAGSDSVLALERDGAVASYTTRMGSIQATSLTAPAGSLTFHGLAPDPETYPAAQPLPSPLEPLIAPLGGQVAAASLDGTLSWDCGPAPGGVPAVEPTPEPTTSLSPTIPQPVPTLAVAGGARTVVGDPSCGNSWFNAAGPIGGETSCAPIVAWVPTATLEAKAGDTLDLGFGSYALGPAKLHAATVAEVRRWRGGTPDTTIAIPAWRPSGAHLRFAAPAAGDWVITIAVTGTKPNGETITGSWLFHVHVAP